MLARQAVSLALLCHHAQLMYRYFVCLYVCTTCMPGNPQKSEEGIGSSGTEVIDCCEQLYECWELNLGPLEDQLKLLITDTATPF